MDYEQKYKEALERARESHDKSNGFIKKEWIETIFPELKKSEDEIVISALKSGIKFLESEYKIEGLGGLYFKKILAWLEKQGEQKPDWNDYDMVVIDAIYNTLKHSNVTKCGVEVTEMLEWLEELEKQGKRNNIVEQLTAFAQHLNKRGAFRDDLCMDFEHEAQSFIEMQNNKEL